MPRSRRSRSLNQDEIVDEAIRLLSTSGLQGLSMRSIAAALGVTPMAVYYYVDNKDDLVRMAWERIDGSFNHWTMSGGDWEATLREHLLATWQESTRYPGLSAYLIAQPNLGVTPEKVEQGVRFFEEAGFAPHTARLAWSFALTYIHGRISVDARLGHRAEAPRLDGLRARDFVEFGVEAVITGLRALKETGPDPAIAAKEARRAPRVARRSSARR